MNIRTRGRRRGLTLIEILIALVVMVLGVVGVLALFPPALESADQSMETTTAAILGESVANAITTAVRFSNFDPTTSNWNAVLTHDLKHGGQGVIYPFVLPKFTTDGMLPNNSGSQWRYHPGGAQGAPGEVKKMAAFNLGGDPWTAAALKLHREKSDSSDPLDRFAFSFRVRKINTLAYLLSGKQLKPDGNPYSIDDLEPLNKLYEFQIFVFRLLSGRSDVGKTTTADAGASQPKRLITTIPMRVSTK